MNKEIKRLDLNTPDGAQLNMDALYQIAPSVFTESRDARGGVKRAVNFDALRQLLGDNAVDNSSETYEFRWVGKDAAKAEAARPTDKTLRPVVEDSEDWDTTKNLYIEGDNLEVLKLLQRSYMGKVKMIYIDPPYNTGNDFVYHDDFAMSSDEYEEASRATDDLGNKYFKNTETSGRFHSDWCNMIYPRLIMARCLLSDDGYICISIDDNEIENVKKMCSEIFGENNFVAQFIIIRSEGGGLAKRAVIGHDYMVVFSKDINACKPLGRPKDIRGKIVNIKGEDYWIETDWFREIFGKYGTCHYEDILKFYNQKKKDEIDIGIKKGDYILIPRDGKHIVGRYRKVSDDTSKFYTILKHLNKNGISDLMSLEMNPYFDYPKPVSLLKDFIQGVTILSKKEENIILDFFSGSATTAHAVMQLNAEDGGNRKFIMVQLPELTNVDSAAYKDNFDNICEIGEERIRRAGEKIKEEHPEVADTLDTGFRIFYVDDSNFNQGVKASPGEYNQQQLDLFANNIKTDRTDLDLLFGSILAWGLQLDLPMETEEVDGCKIYTVNDGDLVACFAEKVTDRVIEAMAEKEPLRVLFRDSCFDSDDKKINLFETFKQKLDWTDDEAFNNIRVI